MLANFGIGTPAKRISSDTWLPLQRSLHLGVLPSRNADLAPQILRVHAPHIWWNVAPDGVIAKLALLHFVECRVLVPTLIEDPIEGCDQARAVSAMLAVQQHRPLSPGAAQSLQCADDILPLDMPSVNWEAH